MNNVVHIVSLLVSANPTMMDSIESALNEISVTEVAHTDPRGKIIVTMETENEFDIVQALTDIQLIDGVVSAALVFHQVDGEPTELQT